MVEALNLPVEMISLCGTDGLLRPLRFRYEDAAHMLRVVRIDEIIYHKETQQAGALALLFVCRARLGETERIFELRYTVREHRWALFRMLS